ncbi:MAG: SelT/SelW/SelH family protein [Planctomycetota bacterium]|nr:MAG: SelT/SelW/SelH family protein [Planctomycetota bacterium]
MTAKLLSSLKQKISGLELQPSGGGCFELTVNGELIYSKLKEGKFPDEAWALAAVSKLA